MKQEEKIFFIQKTLQELFPDPKPSLHFKDPFTLLIAVLLSAQSTDEKVNQITPTLFHLADRPEKMARVSVAVIEKIIRPIGLSSKKAKAIQQLSEILVNEFESKIPQTLDELETLPLVGWKTASVVLAQAFQIPSFPVDTHIIRLAKRWELSSHKNPRKIGEDLMALFPINTWNKLHLQMIMYGRKYCPAKGHKILQCPICGWLARKN